MSSFVSDPKIVDNNEYAIVVSKNQYEDFVLFLCSSQEEITVKLDTEIGQWYLYNREKKIFKRIKPPVPTEVFKTKKGETVIQVCFSTFFNDQFSKFLGYRAGRSS